MYIQIYVYIYSFFFIYIISIYITGGTVSKVPGTPVGTGTGSTNTWSKRDALDDITLGKHGLDDITLGMDMGDDDSLVFVSIYMYIYIIICL
jgi:hypothetical protein